MKHTIGIVIAMLLLAVLITVKRVESQLRLTYEIQRQRWKYESSKIPLKERVELNIPSPFVSE